MPGRSPFQYAIVRVVPRVERGECVNAGVVLFCRPRGFLAARVGARRAAPAGARPGRRPRGRARHLEALARVAAGDPARGPIARAPRPPSASTGSSRPSSTVVQPSPVHTGLDDDPEAELDRLVARLVG